MTLGSKSGVDYDLIKQAAKEALNDLITGNDFKVIVVDTSGSPIFAPVRSQGSVEAASNTSGLIVSLNKSHRRFVDIYYKFGDAATLYVEVSYDGVDWRPYYSVSFASAKEDIYSFETAYPYVRARTTTTGIDVEFEIVASTG